MRRLAIVAISAAAAITILPASSALADHGCNGDVIDVAGVAYVDDRGLASGNVWIYVESNDTPGLQSGGRAPDDSYADPCSHENPDTLIY